MEWKEFTDEEAKGFIVSYGLNPDDFVFTGDERFDDIFYSSLSLGLIRSASMVDGDVYECFSIEPVSRAMVWCLDSWCGPVKYIRAVMPINN